MLLLNTSGGSIDVQIGLETYTVPDMQLLSVTEQQADSILNNYGEAFQAVNVIASTMDVLPDGTIYVGNVSDAPVPVTPSGDVTMDNAWVFTIEDDAITTTKILDDAITTNKILDEAVTADKLDEALQPSHVIKFADEVQTGGGNAVETIAVVGVVATDLVFVQLVDEWTNTVSVVQAIAGTDEIDVTFSADPWNDAVISYQVIRAIL